jgi:hypothetical protein
MRMASNRAYQWLSGGTGFLLVVVGLGSFVAFFRYHMPDGSPPAAFVLGSDGMYVLAFAGCALVAWGGVLLGSARQPDAAPWIATSTSVGLAMCALYRIAAWVVGDYAVFGDILRVEAAVFLALSIGFLWLRPATGAKDSQTS